MFCISVNLKMIRVTIIGSKQCIQIAKSKCIVLSLGGGGGKFVCLFCRPKTISKWFVSPVNEYDNVQTATATTNNLWSWWCASRERERERATGAAANKLILVALMRESERGFTNQSSLHYNFAFVEFLIRLSRAEHNNFIFTAIVD